MLIKIPTLLIDSLKLNNNISKMLKKTNKSKCKLRPHFKTHQLIEIGEIIKNQGINGITVSSVTMANFFAEAGWEDITIAFPANVNEISEINDLAERVDLNLLVESKDTINFLSEKLQYKTGIFIKIDIGYNRTGLPPNSSEIKEIIEIISSHKNVYFKGFLVHAGHTYSAKGKSEILNIFESSKHKLHILKQNYINNFPDLILSYGDTPSCSLADDFSGFDEIRPGNFIYYDVMQYHIGSCKLEDIAVAIACPVVAIHKNRNEIVIYGGAVHLSKDHIEADNNFKLYGYVVDLKNLRWDHPVNGVYLSSLSQEHGIIKATDEYINRIKIGDVIGILPIHSCLSANLLRNSFKII